MVLNSSLQSSKLVLASDEEVINRFDDLGYKRC
jgi:hypothetical protein